MRHLLVVLLLGLAAWTGLARDLVPAVVEQARVKAEAGDALGAIDDLEQLLAAPDTPEVACELLGALYLRVNRPGDALEVLWPLSEGETADPVVLFNMARALHDLGRTAEGERYLERSVALAPMSRATPQLARLRAAAGKPQEVVRLLEPIATGSVAEAMERDDPALALEVATLLGTALLELGEKQASVVHLERVTRLAPSRAQGWERFGKVLVELGRQDEAYDALSRAQSLVESRRVAEIEGAARAEDLLREATVLERSGRREEALVAVRRALEVDPRQLDAWLREVRLLIDLRRDTEALRQAERLAAKAPDHAEAIFLRASARLAVRDLVAAEEDFRRVLAKLPEHAAAINSLALVLMFTDRLEEAESLLLEHLANSPSDSIARTNLERIRRSRGEP